MVALWSIMPDTLVLCEKNHLLWNFINTVESNEYSEKL
ncbi:hypothetical protein ADINL_2023 [Nitrincola lacisaponensis]|uniref:Uncharacterized protein n=1 Tax=Nitrincola lacisaponensis TaxID=267850 RepID=A0A063Y1M2_9GAMM|nr:hypothetical protein ADINL_2023 [Nitrincola lacisaponensis]